LHHAHKSHDIILDNLAFYNTKVYGRVFMVFVFTPRQITTHSRLQRIVRQSVNRCLLILGANPLRRTRAAAQESLRG